MEANPEQLSLCPGRDQGTIVEAEARGYWEPSPEKLNELQKLYLALEGKLEAEE